MSAVKMNSNQLTKMALCLSLLCVSAYLVIPLPFAMVPITCQTIVINLVALLLPPAQAAGALGAYLMMGICGLPVFSGGTAGIGRIFSPGGGFLVGFLAAAILISLLKGKTCRVGRYLLVTVGVGMPVIYAFGTLFLCLFNQVDVRAALMSSVLPFIIGDAAKCVAAVLLAAALNRIPSLKGTEKQRGNTR